MTIAKARKLLGKKYQNLSDKEVEKKINGLRLLATSMVEKVLEIDYSESKYEKINNSS